MAEKKSTPKTTAKTDAASSKPAAKTASSKQTAAKTETKTASKTATTAAAKKPAASSSAATASKPEVAAATTAPKTEAKTKKTKTTKSTNSGSGFKAKVAALTKNNKVVYAFAATLAFIVLLAIVLGITFGARACNAALEDGSLSDIKIAVPSSGSYNLGSSIKPKEPYAEVSMGEETYLNDNELKSYAYNAKYATNTVVGYYGRVIGTVERNIPETTRDEGLGVYPKYGYTLSTVIGSSAEMVAARNALINESSYLTATGTANAGGGQYTWMDENGFLYSGTRAEPVATMDKSGKQRRLYKHSASIGLYMGDVSDDEPGIIKEVTMRNRGYNGYGVTGVYAPAGELIKIQLSDADMTATGGITIHIGQALYNGQANNIWADKGQMQRIPHLLNTMSVNKNTAVYDEETGYWTAYVGSFIGGPVYIRNVSAQFTAIISGGVAYQHFILGYTTEQEFEENAKSSAPYFDLEVWDLGVLHSGPMYYAKAFNFEQLYNAGILWDKVANVACTNGTKQGIVFLYDPFVAAGAAVAFPGRRSVNCPTGWMSSSLNYDSIVSSGSWGNFHEYHHNFQNFGIGYTGEVTNNALTLVDYSLFTKISAARQLASYGGAGLSGWNCYTSASWALAMVNTDNINSTSGLAVYATLLHNFGQDAFINARGYSGVNYFNRWADVTHQDFSYFASQVVTYAGSDLSQDANFKSTNYPLFVPVSSVYQTGRSYVYRYYNEDNQVTSSEKRDIETMKPFVIPYGGEFTVDLRPYTLSAGNQYESGSVIIGNGFKYKIKSVDTSKLNGSATFGKSEDGIYTFTPDEKYTLSGKIRVTIEITTENGATSYNGHTIDDVDLILEFEQSHETNKMTLERTAYFYNSDTMYSDAVEAYEANFAGYSDVKSYDHTNPTQNCNTDIWFVTAASASKFPNATDEQMMENNDNSVHVVEGKLYFEEAGKYRIYLRGRVNCAVYYSLDGGLTYSLGAHVTNGSGSAFYPNNEQSYFDVELEERSWVYFKEILIVKVSQSSYIGLGYAKWEVPLYTTTTDDDGTIHYWNASGQEVTAEEASNVDPIEPTKATYANAYRVNYEFPDNSSYKSNYFYLRGYNYNYAGEPDNFSTWNDGVKIVNCNKQPWDDTTKIDNLLTEGQNTFFHSGRNYSSSQGPMILELDMGKAISANSVTFYGRTPNAATTAQQGLPNEFTVEVSMDGISFTDAGTYTNQTGAAYSATVSLNATYNFRYVKITINSTHNNSGHFILSGITFTEIFSLTGNGANHIAPDKVTYSDGFKSVQTFSCFGHAYLGKKGDTISFEFEGTRLAILNTSAYGKNYEVWIDGQEINSIDVKEVTGPYGIYYLSEKLSSGTHEVVIKLTGEACFDSFAFYNES